MAEIDPVLLRFAADTGRFQAEIRNTTRTVDQQLGLQEARVRRLEGEFRRSSASISASLKGLAATLAASFTGTQLVGLIDNFTRLQNSLRVAGLEGENLAQVQAKLFNLAAKNGVSANALADLYGKAASAAGELGASQDQLFQLTENTALALRVSGVSAEQASGAILGLTQALSSGTVRAEEFNQANEGGLRPLLQAAVASGQFGGSVAKLRNEIVAGNVSSKAFFAAILDGSKVLSDQAAKSVLTISGALTSLNERLTEYVGSNASAAGATGVLSRAIEALADNVGDIIEALAVIAVALGTRFVAGAAAATVSAVGLRVVALGLAVQLNGVAAAARLAGASLIAAMGGPVAAAIGAVALGIGLLAANSESASARVDNLKKSTANTAQEADAMEARLRAAGVAMENVGVASGVAASGIDGVSQSSRGARGELAALEQQAIRTATALVDVQLQENSRRRVELARTDQQRKTAAGSREASDSGDIFGKDGRAKRSSEAVALDEEFRQLTRKRNLIIAGVRNGVDLNSPAPVSAPVSPVARTSRTSTSAAPQGTAASDVEARFLDELDSIRSRILSADAQRATSAEERASFERRQIELSEAAALRSLAADEELTEAQKAKLLLRLSELGAAEREAVSFRERAEIEQRNIELADERGRAQIDALRLQFDLATTEKDRRDLALKILDAEQAILRERLLAQANSVTLNDIEKERARIALAALDAQAAGQKAATELQFASPLKRFAIDANDSDKRVEEAAVRRIEELNQTVTDAFTNALGIKDPFLSQLIKIFLDKNVFGPLAEALSGSGGAGGGLGGLISTVGQILPGLFGRASGGPVMAGQAYRVNEGAPAGRVEAFVPNQSGQIIPLGRMNALASGGASGGSGTVKIMIEEAPGFAARVQTEATGVAIEVVRQSAPQIVDAAANETFRRASRPGL